MNATKRGLAVVFTAQALLSGIVASRSGPVFDDFTHFYLAQREGLTWQYLWWPNFDHLGFWQNLFHSWLWYQGRASWTWVVVASVVSNTLSTYTAWRLGRLIAGPNFWALACSGLVGLSPYWANTWFWWSSVADFVVPIPASFLALELSLRRASTGRRWLSLPIAGLVAMALLSRERMAMMPGAFALLILAVEPARLTLKSTLRRLWSLGDLWAACLVVLLGWAGILVRGGYFRGQLPGGGGDMNFVTSSGQFFTFLRTMWFELLLPGVVGVLPRVLPGSLAWTIGSDLLVLGLLALGVWCLPRAWRALAFAVCSTMISIFPVALGRAGTLSFATEPRYAIDALLFFAPVMALAGREVREGRLRAVPAWVPRFGPALAVALAVLASAGTALTTFRYMAAEWGNLEIARNLRRSIDALPAGKDETVVPVPVPEYLLLAPLTNNEEWSQLSLLVQRMRRDVTVGDNTARRLTSFDAWGRAQRFERGEPVKVAGAGLKVLPAEWGRPIASPTEKVIVSAAVPSGASWVLVEARFSDAGSGVRWMAPVRVLRDGSIARAPLVLGPGLTFYPRMAVLQLDGKEESVGFELPASADGVMSELLVTPLTGG